VVLATCANISQPGKSDALGPASLNRLARETPPPRWCYGKAGQSSGRLEVPRSPGAAVYLLKYLPAAISSDEDKGASCLIDGMANHGRRRRRWLDAQSLPSTAHSYEAKLKLKMDKNTS
jgi:hypothetical protein